MTPQTLILIILTAIMPHKAQIVQPPKTVVLAQAPAPIKAPVAPKTAEKSTNAMISMVNDQRAQAGLSPVSYNGALARGAKKRACTLAKTGQWSHAGLHQAHIEALGYPKSGHGGENLAKEKATQADAFIAWMNSPSHKAQILTPEYIHAGAAECGGIWVLWFSTAYGW